MRPQDPYRPKAKYTREQWAERLVAAATIVKPSGQGPFPLVMQLHGCGGVRPFQDDYAKGALKAGYAVMIVDSFKPRGLSRLAASLTVCTGLQLQGSERAADIYALFHWARSQSWVQHQNIVVSGWSHGGWAIMDALAMGELAERHCRLIDLPPRPLEGLAGAVIVYPYAGFPAYTRNRGWSGAKLAIYALLCGKDQVVGTRYPAQAFDRLERDGMTVNRLVLPDATHAFEDKGASDPRSVYRPDLLASAVDWYSGALAAIRT